MMRGTETDSVRWVPRERGVSAAQRQVSSSTAPASRFGARAPWTMVRLHGAAPWPIPAAAAATGSAVATKPKITPCRAVERLLAAGSSGSGGGAGRGRGRGRNDGQGDPRSARLRMLACRFEEPRNQPAMLPQDVSPETTSPFSSPLVSRLPPPPPPSLAMEL